jgi:asparagine synthase (glutamine-hydrolysing)
MCGIAGLVDLDGLDPLMVGARTEVALARLALRGPDGHGAWSDRHCAFAHTRLAIIDLTEGGAQPMRRGDLVVVFNGEIFNYRALRADLERLGHAFRSTSDTEVLLAGWQQWGEGLLPRLTGMFAFALWDGSRRRLVAARDRFGEKPFLYAAYGRRLAFGSDLIACEAMLGETRPVDPVALRALIEIRFVPEPWSIAQGVVKLPPGHWLKLDEAGLTVAPWYRLAERALPRVDARQTAELGLRDRFDAAVRDRLVADVPVGVFLSGGIDSALVAASVAQTGMRPHTFTVGFEGAAMLDERPLAAAVARHIGAEHTEIAVAHAAAGDVLDGVFLGLDEPFGDASAVPTYLVSQATAKQAKVVLTGDGADEVFAGYRRYWAEVWSAALMQVPRLLRTAAARTLALAPEGKESWALEAVRRARRLLASAHADPVARQASWMRETGLIEIDQLLGSAPAGAIDLAELISAARAESPSPDPIATMLCADVAVVLPGDMLVKVDRMSMANALETRTPFLDQRVVEWAFALPGPMKLARRGLGVEGKLILRTAFRDRLPAGVFERRKRGFEMPVRDLLLGPAAERLAAACDPARLSAQGLFAPAEIALWRRDLAGGRRDTSWRLWTLLAFQEWARLHRRPEAMSP